MKANQATLDCINKAILLIDNTIKLTEVERNAKRLVKPKFWVYVYKDDQFVERIDSIKLVSEKYGLGATTIHRSCSGHNILSEYRFEKEYL